jgi:uncharacterized protein (TIGR03437 family)
MSSHSSFGLLLLVSLLPLPAATINVPGDYPTIQTAIGAAVDGDTIVVAPGTYQENLNFRGKAITLTSSGGPTVTVLDGRGIDSVVRFGTKEGPKSILRGFTVQHGVPSFNNSYIGGGVSIAGASPTITGNVITLNQSSEGAGISINAGDPLIQNNTITANTGEGIYVLGATGSATGPQIVGNVISKNTGGYFGAGIDLFASGNVLIQNNLLAGNTGSQGGAIGMVNGSNPVITQNVIVGNKAGMGGGFYSLVPSGASAVLTNNTIAGNDSSKGSALYLDGSSSGITITNNILVASPGQGAVYCGSTNTSTTPLIRFNDVVGSANRNYEGLCDDQTGRNGNISADPLFVCSNGQNFRIGPGSPAIDVGDNTTAGLPQTDFDSNPRMVSGSPGGAARIDMGAYEFTGAALVSLSVPSLSFGSQLVGSSSAPQTVSVANVGKPTAWLCSIDGGADFPQTNTCSDHLGAGEMCDVSVTFRPGSQGAKSSALSIASNTALALRATLDGTGINPAPVLSTISPASAATAGPAFTLTVNGSGFVANSAVKWNGVSVATAYQSSTVLTAAIPPQNLAQAGNFPIVVTNPDPGGGSSGSVSFVVSNPVVSPGGILNSASYSNVITPGELASIFGANLSSSTATFSTLPLPTTLANTSVYLNDYGAPLLAVSPGQINIQVPWEISNFQTVSLKVVTNGITSLEMAVNVASVGPALLAVNQKGTGQGSILIGGTATIADAAHPVNRTQTISIFCLGLGPVNGAVDSGARNPSSTAYTTTILPTATIGGIPATVLYAGLAPGLVGLYQVNVKLPLNAPTGPAIPVLLAIGDVSSNTVTIGVQ